MHLLYRGLDFSYAVGRLWLDHLRDAGRNSLVAAIRAVIAISTAAITLAANGVHGRIYNSIGSASRLHPVRSHCNVLLQSRKCFHSHELHVYICVWLPDINAAIAAALAAAALAATGFATTGFAIADNGAVYRPILATVATQAEAEALAPATAATSAALGCPRRSRTASLVVRLPGRTSHTAPAYQARWKRAQPTSSRRAGSVARTRSAWAQRATPRPLGSRAVPLGSREPPRASLVPAARSRSLCLPTTRVAWSSTATTTQA